MIFVAKADKKSESVEQDDGCFIKFKIMRIFSQER